MTQLIDTHCHLDFDQFEEDRDQVIGRAQSTGVKKIIVPAIDLDNCRKVLDLADRYDCVYAAIGVHPNSTSRWDDEWLAKLRAMASHEKIVAIGEIGLDYYRDWSPQSLQRQAFEAQLDLADQLDLPVIIHNRQADDHVLDHLIATGSLRGVLHSFSGSTKLASAALDIGFYLGFTGPMI
jgi:TatD DNase family protein